MTTVVNVKVAYIRPTYSNLKEWIKDENNVYIGRKGIVFIEEDGKKQRFPKYDSMFANIYKINKNNDREDVLKKYEIYLRQKLQNEPEFKYEFLKLKNKILGCWCKPEKCHGDIIVKILNEMV